MDYESPQIASGVEHGGCAGLHIQISLPFTPFPGLAPNNCMNPHRDVRPHVSAIYVDMGTTNTRGWLMCGGQMIARFNRPAGVRDTARDGSPQKIHTALAELI